MPKHGQIRYLIGFIFLWLGGCAPSWNSPHPEDDGQKAIYYLSMAETPHHLDPAKAYVAPEWDIMQQVIEAPLEYDYLTRPYTLKPNLATMLPDVELLDAAGNVLPQSTPLDVTQVHAMRIIVTLKPNVFYHPHPAFAKQPSGEFQYHNLSHVPRNTHLEYFADTDTREMVAEDIVYQIKRLADPRNQAPLFSKMAEYIKGLSELRKTLEVDLARGDPIRDLRDYPLEGVKVLDRYRFSLEITQYYPQFLYWLATPFFSPVPWEADHFYHQPGMKENNISFDNHLIGTGPFYLKQYEPNARIVLAKNPQYREEYYPSVATKEDEAEGYLWGKGKRLPFLEEVHMIIDKESIPAWIKFLQGYYDISVVGTESFEKSIQFSNQGAANLSQELLSKGMSLRTTVMPCVFYFAFNMADKTVGGHDKSNRKLRQAIRLAVDGQEFIEIFLNGRGELAYSIIPPDIFGYQPRSPETLTKEARLKKAEQMLAEAGYPNGIDPKTGSPLILYYDSYGTSGTAKSQNEWFKKQFKKLGIQLVGRVTQFNRFIEKMNNGSLQLFLLGWVPDYPDPENLMMLFYGPHGRTKTGGENNFNYNNPAFDVLYDQMVVMPNGAERQTLLNQMGAILEEDTPIVFAWYPIAYTLDQSWAMPRKSNPMTRNIYKYMDVDPQKRYALQIKWNKPVLWPLGALAFIIMVGGVWMMRYFKKLGQKPSLEKVG